MKTLSVLAAVVFSFALIHSANAQIVTYYYAPAPVVAVAPTTTYYAPAAPITTYYAPAAPVTTYYAPAVPVTTYYAPAVPVTAYYAPIGRPGLFGWRWRRGLHYWRTPRVMPY